MPRERQSVHQPARASPPAKYHVAVRTSPSSMEIGGDQPSFRRVSDVSTTSDPQRRDICARNPSIAPSAFRRPGDTRKSLPAAPWSAPCAR